MRTRDASKRDSSRPQSRGPHSAFRIGSSMTYTIKELFYTLQGEGANVGRAAVFCRFAGCNLWTGREADRAEAICQFCDTDFVGVGPDGGKFADPAALARAVASLWPSVPPTEVSRPLAVCTGGEPLLQLDEPLIDALHDEGFEVAVETNGTQRAPNGLDWICVSPKARAPLILTHGDELKLVFPQEAGEPAQYENLDFDHFFLQPMDGPDVEANTRLAVEYCLAHPQWRLSLQTHKRLGLR
jgi:7-carboxy-7-deazaguanine synthase